MLEAIVISVVLLIVLFALLYLLDHVPVPGVKDYTRTAGMLPIEGRDNLYYDPKECIVYMIFNEMAGSRGYGYMSPYYASNGLPYLYDPMTNKLVQISDPSKE